MAVVRAVAVEVLASMETGGMQGASVEAVVQQTDGGQSLRRCLKDVIGMVVGVMTSTGQGMAPITFDFGKTRASRFGVIYDKEKEYSRKAKERRVTMVLVRRVQ